MVDIPKRPESEHTELNRNVALIHATYHILEGLVPEAKSLIDEMIMNALGDDYNLEVEDKTRADGIGNIVGKKIFEIASSNGLNSLGDFGGKVKYNRKPYAPTIKHKPINSPYDVELRDPSRWQPDLIKNTNGQGYAAQAFVTPQLRLVEPVMVKNLSEYHVKPHGRIHPWSKLYKETTDEVINELTTLTERKKVAGDMFNDKLALVGFIAVHLAKVHQFSQIQIAGYLVGANFGIHDVMIVVWREKARYDAVRPFSAVRYLYKNNTIKGYAGPEMGIVDDLPGHEWTSYLAVADHPEYPSATAAVCGMVGEYTKLFTKTNKAKGVKFPMKKGSSLREPGKTPKDDTVLVYYSWDKFAEECAMSRFSTGVHFKDACTEGRRLGQQFAQMACQKIMYHLGKTV